MKEARIFLNAHNTLTLATIGSRGEPQAADLYYALLDPARSAHSSRGACTRDCRDLELCFISASSAPLATTGDYRPLATTGDYRRHVANIARDPRVACTIHASSTRWRDIRGIQMEGTCSRLAAPQSARAWACYLARFPFVVTDTLLTAALEKVDIYRITPHWLLWIDNSVSLGHKVEYRL